MSVRVNPWKKYVALAILAIVCIGFATYVYNVTPKGVSYDPPKDTIHRKS
jgi:hypothetical protein